MPAHAIVGPRIISPAIIKEIDVWDRVHEVRWPTRVGGGCDICIFDMD
jgi:hypothetical protein